MSIHGFQLRCARVACDLTTRDVRERTGLSLTTLAKVEHMGELLIGETQRQLGTVEWQIVQSLLDLYEGLGVRFVEARGDDGPGIRYRPPSSGRAKRKAG